MSANIDKRQIKGIFLYLLEICLCPSCWNGLTFAAEKVKDPLGQHRTKQKDTYI